MTASWSAAYAPHGSPASSGPADWPALRWSIAIIWYCPAYAVSGLIAAISHSGTLERIPPGASVSMGNPVPWPAYQILASPLSTYGTRVSSRDFDSENQRMAELPVTTGIGVARVRTELERPRRPAVLQRAGRRPEIIGGLERLAGCLTGEHPRRLIRPGLEGAIRPRPGQSTAAPGQGGAPRSRRTRRSARRPGMRATRPG